MTVLTTLISWISGYNRIWTMENYVISSSYILSLIDQSIRCIVFDQIYNDPTIWNMAVIILKGNLLSERWLHVEFNKCNYNFPNENINLNRVTWDRMKWIFMRWKLQMTQSELKFRHHPPFNHSEFMKQCSKSFGIKINCCYLMFER